MINDKFGGYIVLQQTDPALFHYNVWLVQQQKVKHNIARHHLLALQDCHPLGELARFPAELREMVFVHAFRPALGGIKPDAIT